MFLVKIHLWKNYKAIYSSRFLVTFINAHFLLFYIWHLFRKISHFSIIIRIFWNVTKCTKHAILESFFRPSAITRRQMCFTYYLPANQLVHSHFIFVTPFFVSYKEKCKQREKNTFRVHFYWANKYINHLTPFSWIQLTWHVSLKVKVNERWIASGYFTVFVCLNR